MKKFLRLLILTISILMVSIPVFANEYDTMLISELYDTSASNGVVSNSIRVQLNGEYVDFTDANGNKVEPQIINDRTMVPMRKIFEVLGATISWDAETRSVTGVRDDVTINLQIDNPVATKTINGVEEKITLDSAPTIVNDRTLVPVRFIAESLDKKVGWDAQNKTVIVIDVAAAETMLKENASNLYEYLTTDFEKINTYEMEMSLKGNVKYEDKEITRNNTTLNFAGDMDLKLAEEAMAIDLDLNFTGKGALVDQLKAQNIEEVEMNFILDLANNAMYMKVNGIEGYGDKWIKSDLGEDGKQMQAILAASKSQNTTGMQTLIDTLLPEDNLTISSYVEFQTMMQLLTTFMSNENFKVSGRTTKTYTYDFDFSDIVKMIMEQTGESVEIEDDAINFEMGFEIKVEDRVAKESNCTFKMEVTEAEEHVEIDIEAEGELTSYNEKVTIEIPSASEVTEMIAE